MAKAPTVAIVIRKFSSKTSPLKILLRALITTSYPIIIYAATLSRSERSSSFTINAAAYIAAAATILMIVPLSSS